MPFRQRLVDSVKRLLVVAVVVLAVFSRLQRPTRWENPQLWRWLMHGPVVEASYTPTPIKSMTDISIPVANGSSTGTQAVNVVATNALLVYSGSTIDCQNGPLNQWTLGLITSNTVVTAFRIGNACNAVYNASLVEYLGTFVRSAGCGVINLVGVVSNTTTIPAVTVAKTALAKTGAQTDMSSGTSLTPTTDQFARLSKTSATVITAQRTPNGISATLGVGYCYLEFN